MLMSMQKLSDTTIYLPFRKLRLQSPKYNSISTLLPAQNLLFLLPLFWLGCSQARSIARKAEEANKFKKQAAKSIEELNIQVQQASWPDLPQQPELAKSIQIKIHTRSGTLQARLAFQIAPLACAHFLYLSQSNDDDKSWEFSSNNSAYLKLHKSTLHSSTGRELTPYPFVEYSEWLRFDRPGVLAFQSMAQTDANQLLISLSPQPDMWGRFSAFGLIEQDPKNLGLLRRLSSQDHILSVEASSDNAEGQNFLVELRRDASAMLARLRAAALYQRPQGSLAAIHQQLARDFATIQWPRFQRQKLKQLNPLANGSQATELKMNWGLEYKILQDGQTEAKEHPQSASSQEFQIQYAVWATQNDGRSLLLEDRIQQHESVWVRPAQLFPAWKAALQNMRPAEKRLYIMPPEGVYGIAGRPPDIPPWSYLIMELYLLDTR